MVVQISAVINDSLCMGVPNPFHTLSPYRWVWGTSLLVKKLIASRHVVVFCPSSYRLKVGFNALPFISGHTWKAKWGAVILSLGPSQSPTSYSQTPSPPLPPRPFSVICLWSWKATTISLQNIKFPRHRPYLYPATRFVSWLIDGDKQIPGAPTQTNEQTNCCQEMEHFLGAPSYPQVYLSSPTAAREYIFDKLPL